MNLASSLVATALSLQEDFGGYEGGGAIAGAISLFGLVLAIVLIAAMWKIFTKAGKPGWASLIPIYNIIVLLEICGKPLWWIVLFLIPFVNFVAAILITVVLAQKFGKGIGFAIGMIILPIIFYPVLAFGDARYQG